ncbi:MAG: MATE family efflux transporter [Christensenellales bacterium]|jgi:putative MATE family efflux protein
MRPKFDWKRFLPALAAIAVPVALQNLLATTAGMVDTMMIAPLGQTTVGAIGLCAQFSSLLFAGYWGFVGGGMLFYGQYWGAKDDSGIDRTYGITTLCLMTVAFTFTGFAIFAPELVMRMYTDKESIREIGISYLRIVGFSYPLTVYSVGMSALLRSTERVKIPLIASICSVLTNVGLNYCLIEGHFGFPAMGVEGAALATVCAAFVNAAVMLVLAKIAGYPYLFHFARHFKWDAEYLKLYFSRCFPILCNEVLIGTGFMITNIVLGRQSENAIAAIAVFRTFEGFVISFFSGFTSAASVLVGKPVGAGELDTAYERAKRLVYLCGATILALCLLIFSIHAPLLRKMSLRGESFSICRQMLAAYCVIAVIRMCNWMQNDTYRAAGDAAYGTILEIAFMYAMVIPCLFAAWRLFNAPFLIVFLCCYIDEPVRFALMQMHLYSGKWIKPVTEQGRLALSAFRENRRKKETFA